MASDSYSEVYRQVQQIATGPIRSASPHEPLFENITIPEPDDTPDLRRIED